MHCVDSSFIDCYIYSIMTITYLQWTCWRYESSLNHWNWKQNFKKNHFSTSPLSKGIGIKKRANNNAGNLPRSFSKQSLFSLSLLAILFSNSIHHRRSFSELLFSSFPGFVVVLFLDIWILYMFLTCRNKSGYLNVTLSKGLSLKGSILSSNLLLLLKLLFNDLYLHYFINERIDT